jgi:hypothetical protein
MQAHAEDLTQTTHLAAPASAVDKVCDRDDQACAEAAELEQLADRVSAARSVY